MALIEFSSLSFGFTDERVVAEASGALHPGNIVGLVGSNGGGKTTLLRILLGELAPEEGRVQRARQARLAYVAQAGGGEGGQELFAYVRGGREDLARLERQIEKLTAGLTSHPGDEVLAQRLGEAQNHFGGLGGHDWEREVERLLTGLSFAQADWRRPLGELSGGQRQKASLARALLSGSNLMILDEPTNHLDLNAQAFLAESLQRAANRPATQDPGPAGILLVSHDRWLLDALASQIWELEGGVLYRYPGNYSRYVPARELRRRQMREAFERQSEYIARTEEYIRRNIAGQNTRQARGRRTLLGRMERMDRPAADPEMGFVLSPSLRSGEQVLIVEDLAFRYGELLGGELDLPAEVYVSAGHKGLDLNPLLGAKPGGAADAGMILAGLSFQLYRGERLGVAGPNGCGKTTLFKLLARQLPPLAGMVAWGSNAELGLFSQDSADLQAGRDLLAELRSVEPGISDSHARDYLARFGFSGDDVFKDVATLSGGERSRLSLAKIFRRRPNVLLLDEPTNHLDIYAREALEQFLEAYQGTVLVVTHDRALLERLCNRLVLFENGEQGLSSVYFRGHYSDFLSWRATRSAGAAGETVRPQAAQAEIDARGLPPAELTPAMLQQLALSARTSPGGYVTKQLQRLDKRIEEVEGRIAAFEAQATGLRAEQRRCDARGDYQQVGSLEEKLAVLDANIELALMELAPLEEEAAAWQRLGESS